eukprot:EG_transcript_15506
MGGYQHLSGAVHAQAGKQICEVWAMAGQCKFGVKCNKLHPVLIAQPTAPVLAVPYPMAAPTEKRVRRRHKAAAAPAAQPAPPSEPLSPTGSAATSSAASVAGPLSPRSRSISPPNALARVQADETECQDLAQYILTALGTDTWEPPSALAPAKAMDDHTATFWQSPTSLFGMDRAFADLLGDLNLSAC